jgi:hypothetical protein
MNRKLLTAAVMSATALSSLSTPAFAAATVLDSVSAAAADANTTSAMEAACTAAAAAHDTANGDIWTGTVVEGDVTWVSGPTEVGSHSYDANGVGDRDGAGTFTPAHRAIDGDPYRVGGSVNMFGIQLAVGGAYSASSYDFQNDFASTYSHAFSCDISVQVYHGAWTEHVPADPNGSYTNYDNGKGQGHDNGTGEETYTQGSCAAINGIGSTWPQWGEDTNQCLFNGERAHDLEHEAYLDHDAFVVNEPQTAVNQDQTDSLLAHESFGEGYSTSETLILGQVVVCISPGKKGGTWTTQNGYTGTKCNTTYFNTAPAGPQNNINYAHNWVSVPVI